MTKVLICGAGAIGSFLGYILAENVSIGEKVKDIALLGRRGHIQCIKETGLRVCLPGETKIVQFLHCFSCLEELNKSKFIPDLVIICVKTYSLQRLLEELISSGFLEEKLKATNFLLLMNGMGNKELFERQESIKGRVHEGITTIGVIFPKDGSIELKGKGKTILESKISSRLRNFLRERFEDKGFEIEFTEDFKQQQWSKLIANSVINPITALTGGKNGIVSSKSMNPLVSRIIRECRLVAESNGFKIDEEKELKSIYSIVFNTSENVSSMLQDISRGKTTEIDSINGYVIRLALDFGIDVPANETLFALIKSKIARINMS